MWTRVRQRMQRAHRWVGRMFGAESEWLRAHAARCPRCRRRLERLGRVELGLTLLRTQPRAVDLLARANAQAIGTLQRAVRQTRQSQALRRARPVTFLSWPGWDRLRPLANVAACLLLVLLMRAGFYRSVQKTQTRGRQALRTYYAQRAGEEIADEIFPA